MPRLAVILGCPRSGTTFLVRALQPLDRAEVISGLVYPPALPHLAATSPSEQVTALLDYSLSSALDEFAGHARRSRSWAVGAAASRNLSLREMVATIRGKREIESVVFKEPFLAFAPDFPYRALPNARIVHIHRDGRDCADSLERKYEVLTDEKLGSLATNEAPLGRKVDHRYVLWWVEEGSEDEFLAASPYLRAVWMWREMIRRSIDFFSRGDVVDSGRVLAVRYEDLMADPVGVGREVVSHLGHTSNRAVDRRLREGHARSVGIHRRRDPAEIARATELAGPELHALGYL